jgi:probable F420-dependent oxidoreductase
MDFWIATMFLGADQMVPVARAAESLGYTGLALADHVAVPAHYEALHPSGARNVFDERGLFPDSLTCIASMATATERLRFMTYVYVVTMREPFSVAKQAGTVSTLSQGRFSLGVGAGWLREEIELLGQNPRTRGKRLDEMLDIVRAFLEDGTTEYHGEFFDFGTTGMYPKPSHPVPIWVGGKSPVALARAARHEGWLGMNYPMEEIEALLPALAAARKQQAERDGRERSDFETIVIPLAEPDEPLYVQLAKQGVTGTVCAPWGLGDPTYDSLDAKLDALALFAARFIQP